jgi:hypothetical protein
VLPTTTARAALPGQRPGQQQTAPGTFQFGAGPAGGPPR